VFNADYLLVLIKNLCEIYYFFEMTEKKVKILVADSVAFIRNAQMQSIAEVVYTLKSVVDEIKDAATKQRLRVLPYEIKMIEPSTESIHFGV